jgi:hypothetical protein
MSISHGMVCEGASYGIPFVYLKNPGTIIQSLDIIHHPVCYLKYNVSDIGLSPSLGKSLLSWAQSIKLVPISGPSLEKF